MEKDKIRTRIVTLWHALAVMFEAAGMTASMCASLFWMENMRLAVVGLDLMVAGVVLEDLLKWHCRRSTAWFSAYWCAFDAAPLPGPLWQRTRAALLGYRAQGGSR